MSDTAEGVVTIDMDEMANSLNGFDQIAVKKLFGESVTDLAQGDVGMFMHALYFVHLRRQGEKDTDAYKGSLNTPLKVLGEVFGSAPNIDPSAEADRDKEWAEFVIGVGLPFTVHQYMELTVNQRAQAIEAARKRG